MGVKLRHFHPEDEGREWMFYSGISKNEVRRGNFREIIENSKSF